MKKLIIAAFFILGSYCSIAQNGFIRGQVMDETTGEPLFGATVVKQGTTIGAVTDFDGNYSISLPSGSHTIVFQSVSFRPIVMEGVEVKEGETMIIDVIMKEDVEELEAVVVTAEVAKSSEMGVMLVQKKSMNTLDGISSSTFRKVGDSNLSSAMKRVTGVSVQGGRYVYVRGLGDRYTKTAINGMVIPGLDPDRNDVQIDIFPTAILENVMVYKNFTPNLPGTFTGGLVDVQTKAFPDEKSTSFSVSAGYNPSMHFRNDYLSYDGSSTDWLGFDNGQRDLPVTPNTELAGDKETTTLFDPTLGGTRTRSFMNTSVSFTHRNQIKRDKITWGYNALLTYRNNVRYFEDFERRQYERDKTGPELVLERDYTAIGDLSENETLWSGLVSLAAKTDRSTIGTTFLNIQNGVSSALDRVRRNTSLNNPTKLYNDVLTYTERNMFNNITNGKHQFGRVRLEWANSLILSKQYEPDYRQTAINEDEGQLGFRNGGLINRFWRDLSELNENAKIDLEFNMNDNNSIKVGGLVTYRDREFDVYNYSYYNLGSDNVSSSDPNDLLVEGNFIDDKPNGLAVKNDTDNSNAYDGTQTIIAAYAMNEMRLGPKLKSVYGVRMEKVNMLYSGVIKDEDGVENYQEDLKTLDELNFLPSLSLVYSVNDGMNIRGSFTKTLARPSFREKSESFIVDPITALWFRGNIDVKQAEIFNYDLRWEYFFGRGEMVSVSTYYKDFTNHIAIVSYEDVTNQVTPRNVGDASAFGAEFALRKNAGFISPSLTNLSIGTNLSYTISKVDRKTVIVSEENDNEYESEVEFKGSESGVDRYRNMSMQAPYAVNAFFNYETDDSGIEANLSYNVQGETLTIVSARAVPEVYTKPFHSLNFKVSKQISDNSNVSLRVTNILNDNNELIYRTNTEEALFSLRRPGRTFTLKYSFNF